MPPDGITILEPVATAPANMVQEEAVQYNSARITRPGAQTVVAEKMSGPVSAQQRQQNQQAFSKLNNIPSIAALKQKEEKLAEAESQQIMGLRDSAFDAPKFKQAWENICQRVRELDNGTLLVTLTKYQPQVDYTTYVINLTIDNRVQEQELNREKGWILEQLRDILVNDKVNFNIVFSDGPQGEVKPYTVEEKFRKMAERNPHLYYLAKKLNLDDF